MSNLTKTEYKDYLQSPSWAALREKVHTRANGRCEKCGAKSKETHHLVYPEDFKDDKEENLQALCPVCHRAVHLERKARKLSVKLAAETDPCKIFVEILAWGLEMKKFGV